MFGLVVLCVAPYLGSIILHNGAKIQKLLLGSNAGHNGPLFLHCITIARLIATFLQKGSWLDDEALELFYDGHVTDQYHLLGAPHTWRITLPLTLRLRYCKRRDRNGCTQGTEFGMEYVCPGWLDEPRGLLASAEF